MERVVERFRVVAVGFFVRFVERLGEVTVVASLHEPEVAQELFVAIEHVVAPVLVAGTDDLVR